MDVQLHVSVTSLKPGDILLMKDNTHDFFRHVAVVTQIDETMEHCQVAHWRGTHYPYALTEMSLPPENIIKERNLSFQVFRLKDQNIAQRAATLLQKWCLWAIPFDKTRFEKAEQYNNDFFNMNSDIFKEKPPVIMDRTLFSDKLAEQYSLFQQQFKDHYLDVVKYALRQNISPVRPKSENEKQTGFHCLQGVLIAFQIACLKDTIRTESLQWVSNKPSKPFNQVKDVLDSDFDVQHLFNAIPPAFQLRAKLASIELFEYALKNDNQNIESVGKLAPQNPKLPYDHRQQEDKKIIHLYQTGLKNRTKLKDEVVTSSIKPENSEVKLRQKVSL